MEGGPDGESGGPGGQGCDRSTARESLAQLEKEMKRVLLKAIGGGDVETIKDLNARFNIRCQINEKDENGMTALHFACLKGQTPVIDLLIQFGCSEDNIFAALSYAASLKNLRVFIKIFEILKDKMPEYKSTLTLYTGLHECCSIGYLQGVEDLLKRWPCRNGSDVRAGFGVTPLMVAAANGHHHLVEHLVIKAKAKVKIAGSDFRGAVHAVAERLDDLKQAPSKADSPQIFKIHERLQTDLVSKWPALSMLCFLVGEGCPWKKPPLKLPEPDGETVSKLLCAYAPDMEPEVIIACFLCRNSEAIPGTVADCVNQCNINVCHACVIKLSRCPNCGWPNTSFFWDENEFQEILGRFDGAQALAPDLFAPNAHQTPGPSHFEPVDARDREQRIDGAQVAGAPAATHVSTSPDRTHAPAVLVPISEVTKRVLDLEKNRKRTELCHGGFKFTKCGEITRLNPETRCIARHQGKRCRVILVADFDLYSNIVSYTMDGKHDHYHKSSSRKRSLSQMQPLSNKLPSTNPGKMRK